MTRLNAFAAHSYAEPSLPCDEILHKLVVVVGRSSSEPAWSHHSLLPLLLLLKSLTQFAKRFTSRLRLPIQELAAVASLVEPCSSQLDPSMSLLASKTT